MSTVIHFECRNATHLAARSRGGVGGIVIHHGTLGYCDGFASDSDHRWVPTGGVFLEQLVGLAGDPYGRVAMDALRRTKETSDDGDARARHVPHGGGEARPLPARG